MSGQGVFAELIKQRFHLALRKQGLSGRDTTTLNCNDFAVPPTSGDQLTFW